MILLCKHGKQVKVQIDWWDSYRESFETHRTAPSGGRDPNADLLKIRPKIDPKREFLRVEGCKHCQYIEMENN